MNRDSINFLTQLKTQQNLSLTEWIDFLKVSDVNAFQRDIEQFKQKGYIKKNHLGQLVLKNGEFFKGIISIISKDFGFVDVDTHEGVYVNFKHFNTAMDSDEVLVHEYEGEDGRKEGKIIHIIQRNKSMMVGTLYADKNKLVFKAYDSKFSDPLPYENPRGLNLQAQQRVVANIVNYDPLQLEINQILGLVTEPGIDVLTILHQHDIVPGFADDEIQQARSFKQEINVQDYPNRRDLTQEIIFTIDGEDTKDIDDAISMTKTDQGFRLGVHIADVSHYVTKNSPIDVSAQERGTSVYVVDRVVPMLPVELSNGLCSLNPLVNRLAMSVYINLDEYGTIIDYEFFESVIQSKQRLDYREVNRFLDNPKDMVYIEESIKETLLMMSEVSDLLRMQREALGAIEFETSESEFIVDAQGIVLDIKEKQRGKTEMMIEDFMVSANQCAANLFDNAQLPTLYRVHEKPPLSRMQTLSMTLRILGYRIKGSLDNIYPADIQRVLYHFRNEPTFHVVSNLVLRSMAKAKYYPVNLGHFGLGIKYYCHFTSPIRRYPDLIVHRNLKKYFIHNQYNENDIIQDEKLMLALGELTSNKERNAEQAERAVEKMKKAQYMTQFVGKKFKGVISGVTKFGMFVQLENTVEGLVHISSMNDYYYYDEAKMQLYGKHNKLTFGLGQSVRVRLTSVDMTEHEINFLLLDDLNGKIIDKNGNNNKNKKHRKKR